MGWLLGVGLTVSLLTRQPHSQQAEAIAWRWGWDFPSNYSRNFSPLPIFLQIIHGLFHLSHLCRFSSKSSTDFFTCPEIMWRLSRFCVTIVTFMRDNRHVRSWQSSRSFVTAVTRDDSNSLSPMRAPYSYSGSHIIYNKNPWRTCKNEKMYLCLQKKELWLNTIKRRVSQSNKTALGPYGSDEESSWLH